MRKGEIAMQTRDFLSWFQAGGIAAIGAVLVSLWRMRIERGEKIEENEATVTVAFLQGLQDSVKELTRENHSLRQYVNERDTAHRLEIDQIVLTHRTEMSAMRQEYDLQISALRLELETYRKQFYSTNKP